MKPKVLWIATGNPKKAKELLRILPQGVRVATIRDAPGGANWSVEEDAPDFQGNARKKAIAAEVFLREGGSLSPEDLVLADDSGLCVDALGGRPGVHSARYAGESASDEERIEKLLKELRGVPAQDRSARFVCALVAVHQGKSIFEVQETCEGRIAEHPSGTGGFGYDPIFCPLVEEGVGSLSFAEIPAETKDRCSHRGKALRQFADFFRNLGS